MEIKIDLFKKYYYLTVRLTISRLKSEHRNKVLGNIWALLNPILFLLIYYIVFGLLVFRGKRAPDFISYLFVGIIVFRFFSQSVQTSSTIIRGNAGIINVSYFPRIILPITFLFTRIYDFLLMITVLFFMLLILKIPITLKVLYLPLVFLVHISFTFGCVLIISWIGIFFTDISDIITIIMRMLFYLSPIIYPIEIIPQKFLHIYYLNPITVLVVEYRNCILYGLAPSAPHLIKLFVISIFLIIVGNFIYSKKQGIFERYL